MQTEPTERRRQPGRSRGGESRPRARVRSSEEEIARLKEIITALHQKEKQAGDGEGRAERKGGSEEEERERGRDQRRRRGRRAASEGGGGGGSSEESEKLRWRVNQLEKEKLELTASHNQELCGLQAELTRLRSSVEQGEAQRVELQYQLTVSQRDADRAAQLSKDKHALTERAAELHQTVQELQKTLDITRQARDQDQHALQQDIKERDRLIQRFGSENQRLHQLLQDQEKALKETERRTAQLQEEGRKEAEVNRRQASEVKYLTEREEQTRREKEASDQRVKALQSSIEAERAAHLESKFNSEIIQLRVRDLEAAVAVERSGQQEAQHSLELLKAQLREVERAYSLERERSSSTERAQERLQKEFEQCKSDLSVALETERKTTSDLMGRLEEEKRLHTHTHSLLEQATKSQSETEDVFLSCMKHFKETLQQHNTGNCPAARDDGKLSLSAEVLQLLKTTLSSYKHRLEETDTQVQDLLTMSDTLEAENQSLRQLTSDQSRHTEESQQVSVKLQQEVTRLRQESNELSTQSRGLQTQLEREREEKEREREEREREREENERQREEREREREEGEKEREKKTTEVQKMVDLLQEESKVCLSFLHCLYQRLLAGCILLDQPQSILGNLTREELCDVINEQVDQLTSDLRRANNKITHLESVCEKKSVCLRELQRSQACVLSRLEESVRKREKAWSRQHTHTVTQLQNQLQLCRSQCDSLNDHVSSLEHQRSSLTSDLSRLQSLLSRGRRESASFLSACALLAGVTAHAHRCLRALSEQKTLLSRRLAEREWLEEEVRRLAGALGGVEGEEEGEESGQRRRRAARRWRRSVCVALAVGRWRSLCKKTTVLIHLKRGSRPAVCVCAFGNETMATQEGQHVPSSDKDDHLGDLGGLDDEDHDGVCARWLHSKHKHHFSSAILSSMSHLQEALAHTGSSPPDVMSAARSSLSRLLDHLLNQSDAASGPPCSGEDTLTGRLKLGLSRLTPPQPDMKALVSSLHQHFLLFSQRLHSAEVERRSLRLEAAKLKRAGQREREAPAQRFHSVCEELRQALSREQEAQTLIQEQTAQLHTLQLCINTHSTEQTDTQHTLSQTRQSLSEVRQELSRKERSLRTLGKHLSGVQRERRQLEERLQRAEDDLSHAARCKDCLISYMNTAERSYKEVRESLIQSHHLLSGQPQPLPLLQDRLETNVTQSIMGAPEVAACQTLLSTFSQLYQTCSSRIAWLEQEVHAHRSHVTALRSELQEACLRDNLAYVPVAEFPEISSFADADTPQSLPLSDSLKDPPASLSTAPARSKPAPSSPPSKPISAKMKEKKTAMRKSRGHVKGGGRR